MCVFRVQSCEQHLPVNVTQPFWKSLSPYAVTTRLATTWHARHSLLPAHSSQTPTSFVTGGTAPALPSSLH